MPETMKNDILANLNNPAALEKLYRSDKATFRREFRTLYPDLNNNDLVGFWNERLSYHGEEVSWGTRTDLVFVVIAALVAGIIAKTPAIFHIKEEFFYPRNIGFIIFPLLTAYFSWKNKLSRRQNIFIIIAMLVGIIFINALPDTPKSDTLVLSCIHLPLVLWSILGFAFVGEAGLQPEKRLGFLRYNGELVVITTLIVIAGGITTAITLGLFSLIGVNIEQVWFEYVVVFGLPAAPIIGTHLTRNNPELVGKVSPVIAKIFSPVVLVMLVVYLMAMVYSRKDPYNDREFLLMFNALLIGVMAIIFFSIAETSKSRSSQVELWVLFALSVITIVVNSIALSAIVFRISEWGFTPNRTAVLGGNLLMLVNLLLVTRHLFRTIAKKTTPVSVGNIIASYLPVYFAWVIVVAFLFPLIFAFK